jgi:outer membrane protein OmpA-like peptidoglycan-associated protein
LEQLILEVAVNPPRALIAEAVNVVIHIAGRGRKRRIVLAGFSDSLGSPELNRALSLSRAQAVAARLKGLPIAGVVGLGPQFPVACEGSAEGRARNRRVEIWLED